MSETAHQVRFLLEGVGFAALCIAMLDVPLGFTVLREASESTCSLVGLVTALAGLVAGFAIALRRLARRLDAEDRA